MEHSIVSELLLAILDPKSRQRDVAAVYAMAIDRLDSEADTWWPINQAIAARWPKGLDRVKTLAWKMHDGR